MIFLFAQNTYLTYLTLQYVPYLAPLHRLTLLSVGKIKTPWIAEGCDMFTERISHSCDFSERILNAGESDEEHKKILEALEKTSGTIVLLDETGKQQTSKEFAQWIQKKRDIGEPITFILGGAYGVNDAIKAKAMMTLSLSSMTFPHELAKLVFLEQLYRAHTIIEGRGYHH